VNFFLVLSFYGGKFKFAFSWIKSCGPLIVFPFNRIQGKAKLGFSPKKKKKTQKFTKKGKKKKKKQ